ncbi:MAG: hypothetical protein JWN86_3124 [Planctomycetota bacterium]|nr:hypothetical protein [Planctomycetota bacterium]
MSYSSDDQPVEPIGLVRTSQIIAGSLVAGVCMFLTVTFVMRSPKAFAPAPWDIMPPQAMITLLGLVMAAMMIVLSFVIPRQIVATSRRSLITTKPADLDKSDVTGNGLFGVYQTQMIIGLAMLEGAAFFNVIAFLIEGHIPSLMAAGVLVLIMLSRFPTQGNIAAWVEDQKSLIREERNHT